MLTQRILSALILGPLALAAVWFGSWAFAALACLATVLLAWEWNRVCLGRFGVGGMVLAVMGVVVAVSASLIPAAGFAAVGIASAVAPLMQSRPDRSRWWMFAGALYIGLPTLALVWVRGASRETLFWLLFVVWATDIGAYAAGRSIGGPKLLPQISPKKTWAGLLGGMLSAAAVGAIFGHYAGTSSFALALLSAGLAVVAQAGDLGESWVKRHFGVKDSSQIIPGHGGVLDRLDGLLAAAPVVAGLCLAFRGGLAEWR